MRIGVLTTSYPRWPGEPAGPFVAALNRALISRGHQVEVLAAAGGDGLSSTRGQLGESTIRRVPSTLFYAGGAPDALTAGPPAWAEALRFMGAYSRAFYGVHRRYDALVSHWLVPCGLLAGALAGARPHVAIAHSSDIHLLRRLRATSLVRHVARRARLVYSAQSLVVPGAPGHVVPMGVDTRQFVASDADRAQARQTLGVRRPTVLFMGRLVPVKGVAVLLAALAGCPDVDLWIAGDGPLRQSLQEQAQALGSRVQFLGTITGDERRQRLWACDLLAVPSIELADGRSEGAPQVVLEGLAAGATVLASRVGGVATLLGDAGYCLPPGDIPAWTAALRAALASLHSAAAGDQRRAAERQAARFDWSVVAEQIVGPELWRPAGRAQPAATAPL